MESLLIWTIALLLTGLITLPYLWRHYRRDQRNRSEKQEAVSLGIDKPKAQYPMIDTSLCIGCGSCVKACPEGGVLGLVDGKATIINGFRCVGHGLCAAACPVEAVQIGLGDLKRRDDIPLTDSGFESSVPGLYIVGELGGLALIKNAIQQGTRCVTSFAQKLERGANPWDVLIVGAGPAGLACALTAKREGLRYLVIDQQEPGGTILQYPRKKLVLTQPVEIPLVGWLKKPEYTKEELLAIWQKAISDQNLAIETGCRLERVRRGSGGFEVFAGGRHFEASRVVLALGRRGTPRKLNVPGEDQAKVAYQLLDAFQYQNEHALVVGGGDSAIEAAMALAAQNGNQVTLSYRKTKFFRIKRRNEERIFAMLEKNQLRVQFESNVLEIGPDFVLLDTPQGPLRLANDRVFIFAGGTPPFDLLKAMGIAFGAASV